MNPRKTRNPKKKETCSIPTDQDKIRLNRYIASSGLCSRRNADQLILAGRVFVDGRPETNPGIMVAQDNIVKVDGKTIRPIEEKVYIALNKPKLVITSKSDEQGRTTVMDLLPERLYHLNPVGRLDFDSSGLVIMTNDGELANLLTHPRFSFPKTYQVRANPPFDRDDIDAILGGVQIAEDVWARADRAILSGEVLTLTIHEGKYHHIKRMAESLGKKVCFLRRTAIGPIKIDGLLSGQWRMLTDKELSVLLGKTRR
ncbi:MAG: rRNA pseudouridine synthase [Caldisericales bacterium]|nr:rRNA pseudouridine synthase [Caldisericales bacterium]